MCVCADARALRHVRERVALFTQHTKRMRRIILSSVASMKRFLFEEEFSKVLS